MAVEIKQCDLLPCPFCGGNAVRQWHTGPCWIECGQCGAVGPNDGDTTTEQNEAAWNTRIAAEQRQPSGDVAKMREALAPFQRALDIADRLIERGYGLDVPEEWNNAFKACAESRIALSLPDTGGKEAAGEGDAANTIRALPIGDE